MATPLGPQAPRGMGPRMRAFLDSLPQESFEEVRAMRDRLPDDAPEQVPLALEDRRAFARQFTRDHGPLGAAALLPLIPAEVLVKAAGAALRPVAPGLFGGVMGRSGFTPPLPTVGAGFAGLLQGLDDLRSGR